MIIIRKPKSMRNDALMEDFLRAAEVYKREMSRTEYKYDKTYWDIFNMQCNCLVKAAKAGGFRNTKEMERWLKSEGRSV